MNGETSARILRRMRAPRFCQGRAAVIRRAVPLALLCTLSACGGGGRRAATGYPPNYAAPGPPSDPWGPYIKQAASRFDVPPNWIRAVMHQESGGHQYLHGQPITSDAGAAGLMQLMPPTYAELAERYGLGPDPYEPHDNIMAGTGYIKQLYNRYGSPTFLAAYNAGPSRVDAYLAGRGQLPHETVNYLASIAPSLSQDRPLTGALAAYADAGPIPPAEDPVPRAYARAPSARCWQDPDAAYDPDAPCRTAPPVLTASVEVPPPPVATPASAGPVGSVLVAGSVPAPVPWGASAPVSQPPSAAYQPAPQPVRYVRTYVPSAAATVRPAMSAGRWAIQLGAFANPDQARRTAESVRSLAPRQLGGAQAVLGRTAPFGGVILYRARLAGLSVREATAACTLLTAQAQACVTIPPGG